MGRDQRQQRFWIGREIKPGQLSKTEMLSWNEYQYLIKELDKFRKKKWNQ